MSELSFESKFRALTDNMPFPWQQDLYENWFSQGKFPDACTLPTGLGKTSVIAVWLIALANGKPVPRRLVYVVNRRTVVDQTTDEVEKYRKNLAAAGISEPLAISTLRGQFADNREWSADPSRPAVICGTVDMIGSRLLFSGYGVGFKGKPLHAGFLGQDVLLVHDEAHLEPAFQDLLVAIHKEQHECERTATLPWPKLRVMELTATSRGGGEVFALTPDDHENDTVKLRIGAKKLIEFHHVADEKSALVKEIVARATGRAAVNAAVVVFVRSVERAGEIAGQLEKVFPKSVEQLNGTLRGYERDRLVKKPVFQRFLPALNRDPDVTPAEGAAFLVCTSAGEVGVNISADHLVCDLSTFDSMAQRFGRVNRFGEPLDHIARIDVVHPKEFAREDKLDEIDRRRKLTLEVLKKLDGDGSPRALGEVHRKALQEGSGTGPMSTDQKEALRNYILSTYALPPPVLPTSDILFDAWALTTVRDKLPGRSPVEPYLHGVEEEKQRETHVTWRREVELFRDGITGKQIGELLDEFPLRPHELLRDATYRVQDELAELAVGREGTPVWVIDPDETVTVLRLGNLVEEGKKGYAVNLSGRTVVLPPSAGGLTATGTLSGSSPHDPDREYDVAGRVRLPSGYSLVRLRITPGGDEGPTYDLVAPILDPPPGLPFQREGTAERLRLREVFSNPPMRVAYRLDLPGDDEDADEHDEYLVLKPESAKKVSQHEPEWPALDVHCKGVKEQAEAICSRLHLPDEISLAVVLAAGWHDLGKGRGVWQRGAGNRSDQVPVSKPIHGRPPENLNHFRHELGSLIDVCGTPELATKLGELGEAGRELALHLIAAHHGRGRPHFPVTEADDPERPTVASESVAADTPARFARLQRRYGRWGLAYLESLVRAADALDSKRIEETPIGDGELGQWPKIAAGFAWPGSRPTPEPGIRVAVDPTNPGQFFACCGLLELADRLWPGAEGWFEDRQFGISSRGTLSELLSIAQQTQFAGAAEEETEDEEEGDEEKAAVVKPLEIVAPVTMRLDWWQDINLKPWAGSMNARNIALAMCRAIDPDDHDPLNQSQVVPEVKEDAKATKGRRSKPKPKEPFHFDARRGSNSLGRDVGFIHDTLKKKWKTPMFAHPVVEFFALLGLQRARPQPTDRVRVYDYFTWSGAWRCQATVLPLAVCGLLGDPQARRYRFVNAFRTGQKKHKAYMPASPLPTGDSP